MVPGFAVSKWCCNMAMNPVPMIIAMLINCSLSWSQAEIDALANCVFWLFSNLNSFSLRNLVKKLSQIWDSRNIEMYTIGTSIGLIALERGGTTRLNHLKIEKKGRDFFETCDGAWIFVSKIYISISPVKVIKVTIFGHKNVIWFCLDEKCSVCDDPN